MTTMNKGIKDIPAYESLDTIISGVSLMSSARSVRHTFSLHSWLFRQPQASLRLLDLILGSRSFSVTKSEDKVFGMLGVTSQDTRSNYLRKDPPLSPGDVFRNFVLWDIFENNSLRALGSSSDKAGSQHCLPSWVPDLERLDPQSSLNGTKNQVKFNASGSLPRQVWTSNNETVLNVKGKIVDTLHTIGEEAPAAPKSFAGKNAHVLNFEPMSHLSINKNMIEEAKDIWLAATERLAHCHDPFITGGVKRTFSTTDDGKISWAPFLRTLVCNRTMEGKRASKEFIFDNVASFVRQTLEVDVVPEYLLQRDRSKGVDGLEAFTSLTKSRRFAATDIGLVGYVPMRAKKGDLVCILYGSEVPFVVRKEAEGKYSLIGECYIHGIMEGEAIRLDTPRHKEEVLSLA